MYKKVGWASCPPFGRSSKQAFHDRIADPMGGYHDLSAQAKRITLVLDNLNTHTLGSLYRAFDAQEALRIAEKVELVYTPKHGSWLNIAQSELSVLSRQCLGRRLADTAIIAREAKAWAADRNANQAGVDWQFTTDNARAKLKRLYPKVEA